MERFDLCIPIGRSCRPASHLINHGLRREAFPLDWIICWPIQSLPHLFETDFSDFFAEIREGDEKSEDVSHRVVHDNKNNLISMHHFPKALSLEEGAERFRAIMIPRAEKMKEKLENAETLLLLCNRNNSMDSLKSFLEAFSNIYPHLTVRLVNIRNIKPYWFLKIKSRFKRQARISNKASITEYLFSDNIDIRTGQKYDWRGNTPMWDMILSQYALTNRFADG